jgi:hypothetical protein
MKRAILWIAAATVAAFVAGILVARLPDTVTKVREGRNPAPARQVSANWPQIRLSPGHSQHVFNQEVECNDCHDPTIAEFEAPDTGVCTQCHEEQASLAHVNLDGTPMDCYTCHIFGEEPEVFGRWHCTRCHGPFETNAGLGGLSMHTTVPCETCHNPHKPVAETVRECDECHEKMNLRHGRPKLSGSCTDCHGGHQLATDAASCMSCHGTEPPIVPASATFREGHDSCANCHKAHSFSAATALRCNSCHKGTRVLAQSSAREHRDCNSCHTPHDVRAVDDRTCKGCHEKIALTHAPPSGKDCIGCHEPHPKRAAQIAVQCSGCHEEAGSERAFHAGNTPCTGCHEPHRFDLSNLSDRALCRRCHVAQTSLTRRNLGHSSCSACHQGTAHEPAGVLTCGSCHKEKLTRSPTGHRECASCHEPHSGNVSPETSCAGCHRVRQLPGLHRLQDLPIGEGHTKCAACHDIHETKVRAARSDCMTCHEDVADHQPDAKVCTGCHTFIRAR